MNKLWIPVLVTVLVAGCSPDRTLDSLIPRDSLAVVLVDHPSWVAQTVGTGGDFPWKALETGKPWAGAVLPSDPPGFLLAVALAETPSAWTDLRRWANDRGGLKASRLGSYAVLSSPGLAEPGVLDPDRRFDLERVRAGGDPVAVYIDAGNAAASHLPAALQPAGMALPWVAKNLNGLRLGFGPKDGGLEVRLATDWKAGSEAQRAFDRWTVPEDPATWSGLIPAQGLGLVMSLPSTVWTSVPVPASALAQRWASLAPLLGPRIAIAIEPQKSGDWGWAVALETSDPEAVRQALRTLVASGDVQKEFPHWALDADTPLIYRDLRPAEARRASLRFGSESVDLFYGPDRVVVAGGTGVGAVLDRWSVTPVPAPWVGQAPPRSSVLAAGALDGLSARAAVRVLGDRNVELRTWIDREGVKAWEERLPQALMGWLAGAGGWTNLEP